MHSTCILSLLNCNGMHRKCTRQPACVHSRCARCLCAAVVGSVRRTPTSVRRSIGNNRAQRNAVKVPIYRFTEKSWNIGLLKSKERRRAREIHNLSSKQSALPTTNFFTFLRQLRIVQWKKVRATQFVPFTNMRAGGSTAMMTNLIAQHDHWTVHEKRFWHLLSVWTTQDKN